MVHFDHEPEQVKYVVRPDGKAEVWIRRDIRQEETPEGGHAWVAEEVHFQTVQTREEIVANADVLFFQKSGIQKRLTDAVQNWMDEKVHTEKDYDNLASACSYANSTDPIFRAEAEACIAWRDRVWRYCYNVLNAVKVSLRSIPTVEELLAELDAELPLVWPEAA